MLLHGQDLVPDEHAQARCFMTRNNPSLFWLATLMICPCTAGTLTTPQMISSRFEGATCRLDGGDM